MTIKHQFDILKSDGTDVSLVRPSDWNAEHVIDANGIQTPSIDTPTAETLGIGETTATSITFGAPTSVPGGLVSNVDGRASGVSTTDVRSISSAVSVVLTSSDVMTQLINMTVGSNSVTLPDATTIHKGTRYIFRAMGSSYTLNDAGTAILYTVQPGVFISASLVDNATIAGVWSFNISTLQNGPYPGLANSVAVPNTAVSNSISRLTNTTAICAYQGTLNMLQAVVTTISGNATTVGTIYTIDTTAISYVTVSALSATRAICAYRGADGYVKSVVLDATGGVVTSGSIISVNSIASSYINVAALSATQVICTYQGTNGYLEAVILDINNLVITVNAIVAINSVNTTYVSVAALSATQAICAYQGTNGYLEAVILDVVGSVITPGIVALVNSVVSTYINITSLSSTKAICAYVDNVGYAQSIIFDVSGSVITSGVVFTVNNASSSYVSVASLSSSSVVYAYVDNAGVVYAIVLSVSGSVVSTAGTAINVGISGVATYAHIIALTSSSLLISFSRTLLYVTAGSIATGALSAGSTSALQPVATYQFPSVTVRLSDTTGLNVYLDAAYNVVASVFTKVGADLTPGPAQAILINFDLNYSVIGVNSTQAVVVYVDQNDGYIYASVLTIAGTTITVETPTVVNTAPSSSAFMSLSLVSTDKIICSYTNASNQPYAVILDVVGSSIVSGAVVQIRAANGFTTSVTAISASQAVCVYRSTSNYTYGSVLNISGSTIAPQTAQIVINTASTIPRVSNLDGSRVICTYYQVSNLRVVVLTVSGNAFSVGTPVPTGVTTAQYKYSLVGVSSSNAVIVCVDSQTNTFLRVVPITTSLSSAAIGTIISLNTFPVSYTCGAVLLSPTTVVYTEVYGNTTYNAIAGIVAISDVPSASYGVPIVVNPDSPVSPQYGKVVALSSTKAISVSCTTTAVQVCILNISGFTVAPSMWVPVSNSIVNNDFNIYVAAISSARVIAIFTATTTSYLQAVIIDASGALPVVGTVYTVNSINSSYMSVTALSSSQALCAWRGTSTYLQAMVLDIVDMAITPGPIVTVNATSTYYASVGTLTTTKAICSYYGTNTALQSVIFDVVGSVITAGVVANDTPLLSDAARTGILSSTKAICLYIYTSTRYLQLIILNISGSTVVPSTIYTVPNISVSTYANICVLSPTKVMCMYQMTGGSTANSGFRALIFSIDGDVISSTSASLIGNLSTQVVAEVYLSTLSDTKAVSTYRLSGSTALQSRVLTPTVVV
jgi:hypothetical protein